MSRALIVLLLVAGCANGGEDDYFETDCSLGMCDVDRSEAICTARVRKRGSYNVETYYLPRVVACEFGEAPPEAMRAQAIAARSYLYYMMASRGSIGDSQADQVFSCGRTPDERHLQAVSDTSGQFLRYRGVTVAGFYVAGATPNATTCVGRGTRGTERYVTYNENLEGSQVRQSKLGWVSSTNLANRGAMSQNGAECLANSGYRAEDILHFYYGADIEIAQAIGPCVTGPVPEADDIGLVCGSDDECDEHCEVTVNEAGALGFCSAACTSACPGNNECVDLGAGSGSCAPLTGFANSFCVGIPGTEPTVLRTARDEWKSVCAPLALETTCSVAGYGEGECVDTEASDCLGQLHTGRCPGPANIRCCTGGQVPKFAD